MPNGLTPVWRQSARARLPARVPLRDWLHARGSLTAHLTRVFGPVEVQRLHQGRGCARVDEALALGLQPGQRVFVREVSLRCEGQVLVMARSVCDRRHLHGVWRGLHGLGSRPLAELLFSDPRVDREPLSFAKLSVHQRRGQMAMKSWFRAMPSAESASASNTAVLWQRRSVFKLLGARLLVSEMFSPQFLDETFGHKFSPNAFTKSDNT